MTPDPHEVQTETIRYLLAVNAEKGEEIRRLTAELAAAQAERAQVRAPRLEWQKTEEGWFSVGFFLSVDPDEGWRAEMSDGWGHVRLVASGLEIGNAGKAYCEATRESVLRRTHKLITDSMTAGKVQV